MSSRMTAIERSLAMLQAFVGVEDEVVELLQGTRAFRPTVPHQHFLAGAIVAVGQHGSEVKVEPANVLPPLHADRTLGLVGRVIGDFGEDGLVQLLHLAADERQQEKAFGAARTLDVEQAAEGRENIDVRHQGVAALPPRKPSGPRRISITPMP